MKSALITVLVLVLIVIGMSYISKDSDSRVAVENQTLTSTSSEATYYKDVKGFYAEPQEKGDYPGIVLIHEWWGLNDHIKDAAVRLSKEGYRVLAVDLYDGKVATTAADAQKFRNSVQTQEALDNLKTAARYLNEKGAAKVASFGWCFGGGKSLELAVSGEELDATVLYYGTPITDPEKLKKITWPLLGIFGEADASISTTSVAQFDAALDSLKIDNEIYVYPKVGHAFANPSNPNYAPAETADAWQKTLAFLKKNLKD